MELVSKYQKRSERSIKLKENIKMPGNARLKHEQNKYVSEPMEPLMYAAIIKMVKSGEVDEILTEKEKLTWKARILEYSVRADGGLLWNGLKVPTLEQIEQVLQPVHFSGKRHLKDKRVLRKKLSDLGFVLPKYLGGLERACTL